jgi:hypothetical protein
MRRRTWRLAAAIAVAMLIVALIVAVRRFVGEPQSGPVYEAPSPVPLPVLTFLLLSIPAGVAAIAVARRSPTSLVVAGALALLQSFVSFAGATFGFLLPGLLLMYLGVRAGDAPDTPRPSVRERLAGLVVIGLVVAAWLVTFAASETVCWAARLDQEGHATYRLIGDTGSIELGPSDVAGGCDSGVPTVPGLLGSALLVTGALTVSARSGRAMSPGGTHFE